MREGRTRSTGILENSLRGFFSQDAGGASLGPGIQTGIVSSVISSIFSSESSFEASLEGPVGVLSAAAAPLRGGESVGEHFRPHGWSASSAGAESERRLALVHHAGVC